MCCNIGHFGLQNGLYRRPKWPILEREKGLFAKQENPPCFPRRLRRPEKLAAKRPAAAYIYSGGRSNLRSSGVQEFRSTDVCLRGIVRHTAGIRIFFTRVRDKDFRLSDKKSKSPACCLPRVETQNFASLRGNAIKNGCKWQCQTQNFASLHENSLCLISMFAYPELAYFTFS